MADIKNKLHELVEKVVQQGGSDLHISEERKPILRINGELVPVVSMEESTKEEVMGMLRYMLNEDFQKKFTEEQNIDFSYSHEDKVRFRGNAFVQQGRVGIVMRLIPNEINPE